MGLNQNSTLFAEILCATGAGCATTIVGHPLDTIKVHLQTNNHQVANATKETTTWAAAKALYRQNALFRGIVPPLANAVIMNTVMFSVFHEIKSQQQSNPILSLENNPLFAGLLAGILSGFATACISTPTDYIKIQAQLLRGGSSSSVDILKKCTLPVLFRGHVANLWREGVFTMTYLGLYDYASPNGFWQVALLSSCTGGLAWIVSYPFDTIKSVIQSQPFHSSSSLSMRTAAQQIWDQGGMRAFYRGCGASTGRAIMVTSLRMIVYEYTMKLMSFL